MYMMIGYYQFRDFQLNLFAALAEPPTNPAKHNDALEQSIAEPKHDHTG